MIGLGGVERENLRGKRHRFIVAQEHQVRHGQDQALLDVLELLRHGRTRHRCPYVTHPAAAATEFVVLQKRLKMRSFATFSRRAYFSKPRMYGMTGGRGPVLNSGPRVER